MSNIQTSIDAVRMSFQDIWLGVANFIPSLIAAIIVFLLGWLVAVILSRLVAQIIKTVKLDVGLRAAGFDKIVERSGFTLNSGHFLGTLVEWFFLIVALVAALDILKLTAVTGYLSEVVLGYLPKVIIAVLILLVSVVIAQAIQKLVSSSAKAANIPAAHALGEIAKWAIWIFAFMFALSQLEILNSFIQPLFIGIIAAISIALGLSFGLGGKEAAAKYIAEMKDRVSSK